MFKKILLADDDKYPVRTLLLMRVPPLIVGLVLGFVISFATSRFEKVLAEKIEVVFFLPFIVYMASAIGSQTQTIYSRDLTRGKANFITYLFKEMALGLILGTIFGFICFLVVSVWFGATKLALTVGMSLFVAMGLAPLVALIVTEILELEHQDPAVGAGPIATVIQDTISVIIYGAIASLIIL
ncbi:hypothetical protein A2774_01925 [Candidatus Roizmanbacteria bacterium RIFCSPHIGHO2_01_FULL_39_12c]|uniref:SLC41A/MgtE integral membrane domain-containing protein n=1 Tax=Candidatus Roizmanbacteria bacterium RIFCSPHIGHO2_01_FULL_39_12c TaxID=1802031 RepID=A0A1F7GF39_9BACT|nr:MAG: hypothetical protein A2774_01925 [Candidatus Roizmanbacteria bacterium RIFCSPHIGHO2_01_FULL_39_12c]